jgi:hypothetical protein
LKRWQKKMDARLRGQDAFMEGFDMNIEELLSRRIPLALAAALLLQAGTAVWWAASHDAEARFENERIAALEQAVERSNDSQTLVIDRLARIEERLNAEAETLARIEKRKR